jgi:hypothetical protein
MNQDLAQLARDINERRREINKARQFYEGYQPVQFLGSRLETNFADKLKSLNSNRCGSVVDLLADRLEVTGFSGDGSETASDLWKQRDLDIAASEIHQEALLVGDAFVLVLPNRSGIPTIYVQRSESIAVAYDEEDHQEIRVAGKAWRLSSGFWRFNLYYADRIEKYITTGVEADDVPTSDAKWEQYQDDGDSSWPLKLNFTRVPVFHFGNNSRRGDYGRSELTDIYPLQDALNLTLANQMVALEFAAVKQRYATGLQIAIDENGEPVRPFQNYGAGELWVSSGSGENEVRFGEFSAADLAMFETMVEGYETRIARTARIPLHYINPSGGGQLSGEALKTAEAPMVSKIRDRQAAYGNVWSRLMEFLLELDGVDGSNIRVLWKDAETRSEVNFWTNAVIKNQLGVSGTQILREAGYSPEDIERFAEELQFESEDIADQMLRAFNSGE